MAEIGRNLNAAFDRGRDDFFAYPLGTHPFMANPYKVRHMRNAWRAGWDKEAMLRRKLIPTVYGDKAEAA
jgi:hypothetical protein